ncbi:MAG: C-terminal helicase domain-containing protein, partial [Olsenella sp.]
KANWAGKLDLSSDVDTVFRNAQKAYNAWTKLPPDERTTDALTDMLSFDFFTILDEVTVARSRKHIQRHYDMEALGAFPQRNKPISKRAKLTDLEGAINYHEIYAELDSLSLVVYMPSAYILPSRMGNYEESNGRNLSIKGREWGIRKLMQTNLLKRLESSVHSFSLTLSKVLSTVEAAERAVDAYIATKSGEVSDGFDDEYDDLDFDDEGLPLFEVGGKTKVEIADMDYLSWQRDLAKDRETLELLVSMIADITPENDAKLKDLCKTIADKVANPINEGNRKVLVFTAFADTADYLYEHVSRFAKERLGLETAIVTGKSTPRSTVKKIPGDMNMLLTCFSPLSKERDIVYPEMHHDIDILIGTDCISEGQNLQDCDYLINYDIHWNPVRIIQRFGRIDRIGSKNARIQLVNYWPDVELDEYIRLKERVEARMRAAVLTSTGDDDYINEEETGDLEYRERQLRQMQEEVIDLEDVSGGVSITDLGLNEFRMDLLSYHDENPDIENMPHGIHAVVKGDEPGILFV